ncbi:unnamed protein product [Gordionus sp. m RMFG-2023]
MAFSLSTKRSNNEKLNYLDILYVSPTKVDTYMYANLAILYYAPLKNAELKSHLLSLPNLVSYVQRFTQIYFNNTTDSTFDAFSKQESEWPNKKRDKILWGIFIMTSITTYAFLSGIIKIEYV